jgi:acyl carrier protein phosphodiesterase
MLPDLSAMLGVRMTSAEDPRIDAGIHFHYTTDAAFHGAPHFVRLCAQSVEALTSRGVGRGTARAVGHVGVELLLDGLLSHDEGACEAYQATLANAVDQRLADTLAWPAEQRERMHAGLARLQVAPVPAGYREPAFVTERLQTILSRRPRLAMQPGDLPQVAAHVQALQDDLTENWRELLEQVRTRLGD